LSYSGSGGLEHRLQSCLERMLSATPAFIIGLWARVHVRLFGIELPELSPCAGVGKSQPVLKTDEDNALTAKVHEHIMPPPELNTKESNNVGCFKV